MKNGFVKVAAITPPLHLADTAANTNELIRLTEQAASMGVALAVFPELCITGATCGDLFFSQALIHSAKAELKRYLEATKEYNTVTVIGLPIAHQSGKLYNCAAVCLRGEVLGYVPKTHLTQAETRYFTAARNAFFREDSDALSAEGVCAASVFHAAKLPLLAFGIEIGCEANAPCPPSIGLAMAGANIICNPSAIPETVTSSASRRASAEAESARLGIAYITASAGTGESTTDHVYGAANLICENGKTLAESTPLCEESILISEIDVELLAAEHRRQAIAPQPRTPEYDFCFELPITQTKLTRHINPHPFIPEAPAEVAARCEKILEIQAHGLKERIKRAYVKKAVIGISGGLDSTLALLVATRAMALLERPYSDILAVTMPCFGTTSRTKSNATLLCKELGVELQTVSVAAAVEQHFADIGHDPRVHDVTYENCQARERTQVLMDIANACGGMVIGTGDLSELALGWATYNGDHMSMYGVNGGVPKTLIRYIVAYSADVFEAQGKQALAAALRDILDTPVSPELLPAEENGEIAQKTEDLVGPYELHDFYLYYLLRYGYSPTKLYRLAAHALGDRYDRETLIKWLEVLCRRFFAQQFKRSCLPDGPAVGSVSLSPRGAWLMPSDALSAVWLREVEALKNENK